MTLQILAKLRIFFAFCFKIFIQISPNMHAVYNYDLAIPT